MSALDNEIASDPESLGYADMRLQENAADLISEALKAENRSFRQLVPIWKIKKRLLETSEWPSIVAAQSSSDETIKAAALSAVAYIDDQRFDNLDYDLAGTQAMIGVLVSNDIVSAGTRDFIEGLATGVRSRATEIGLSSKQVRPGDVQRSLRRLAERGL